MGVISEQIKKSSFKTKSQVSMEYMAIIGVTTIVTISLLLISNYYSKEVEGTINTNQLDRIAKEIVDTAESMYYFGEPSKSTMRVYIPPGIKEATVGPNEISFKVSTKEGDTDIFYSSSITLQGNLSTSYGYHFITIEAKEGYVWINST